MQSLIHFISDKNKHLIIVSAIITVIHQVRFFIEIPDLIEPLLFAVAGLFLFFIGYGMSYFVLGFQVINPFCPRSVLKFFCYFFIGAVSAGYVLTAVSEIGVLFRNDLSDVLPISNSPLLAGFLLASVRIYEKHVVEESRTLQKRNAFNKL